MKDKTKHKYLVGFIGDSQCIYGKDEYAEIYNAKVASFTKPMTLLQAKRGLKQLSGKHKTVYELKPISNLAVHIRTEMVAKAKK